MAKSKKFQNSLQVVKYNDLRAVWEVQRSQQQNVIMIVIIFISYNLFFIYDHQIE